MRTIVAVVADHGEEFFEHGRKGHQNALFEESVRVPWILRWPGVVPAGGRVAGAVGLEDVAPTLLALIDAPMLPEATGRDLSAEVRSGESAPGSVLLTFGSLAALRGRDWKLVLDAERHKASYFDLASDPGEQRPRPAHKAAPDRLRALVERLAKVRAQGRRLRREGTRPVELDAGSESKLRALGYIE